MSLPIHPRAAGPLTDHSGTITLGGTAQRVLEAKGNRQVLIFQSFSDGDLYLNFGAVPTGGAGDLKVPTGQPPLIFAAGFVPSESVWVFGATTGKAFTLKEG